MCDCIKTIDRHLAEHNSKIVLPMIGPQLPFIETAKIDSKKRGSLKRVFASHCPFCGEKYPKSNSEAA